MVVAVDFDGTLVKPVPYPEMCYELNDNAETVIRRLNEKGVTFVLFTARYGWWRLPAIRCIKKNKLPIKILWRNKKPRADLYVDDHNIFCDKIDWLEVEQEILRVKKRRNI